MESACVQLGLLLLAVVFVGPSASHGNTTALPVTESVTSAIASTKFTSANTSGTISPNATTANTTSASKNTSSTVIPPTTKGDNSTKSTVPVPTLSTKAVTEISSSLTSVGTPGTAAAPNRTSRFDVGSFIGGIILTLGIILVLYLGCRFYNSRRGVRYRTIDEHEAII